MTNETIPTISIEDLKQYHNRLEYVDDDFVVINEISNMPDSDKAVRVNFLLFIVCMAGRMQLDINGRTYTIQAGGALICIPTMILSRLMFSAGHRISMIGFSTGFLQRTVKKEIDSTMLMSYIYKYPIQYATEKRYPQGIEFYQNLFSLKLKNTAVHYHKEILQHLFSALFFEIMSVIYQNMQKEGETEKKKGETKQPSLVFKRFMEELTLDNGMHRTVHFFADRLCYSPKYVSSVIKQVSGRTAMEWINEYAIEQIKHRLKFSEKSIKEIAEEFNFPNQSFFGKYVKAHVGMSPARYRNYREE